MIHREFPGQFANWAEFFAGRGDECFALGAQHLAKAVQGVALLTYEDRHFVELRDSAVAAAAAQMQRGVLVGQALEAAKESGLEPELILFHPGWGEGLFLREVFPNAKIIPYLEWYFRPGMASFDPEVRMPKHVEWEERSRNTVLLHALEIMDAGIAPTHWQKSQLPEKWQSQVTVLHEGVDDALLRPNSNLSLHLGSDLVSRHSAAPLITFAARSLEPMRGFHWFMRSLPHIFAQRPDARVMIVGGEGVAYSPSSTHPGGYKGALMEELSDSVPWDRVHFAGYLDRQSHVGILQISACHVYLTAPFVTSWSLLEAMLIGAPIVGSETGPLQEFVNRPEGPAGSLANQFDPVELARAICTTIDPTQSEAIDARTRLARTYASSLNKQAAFKRMGAFLAALN